MKPELREKLLNLDRLMDEIEAECHIILAENNNLKPASIEATDDAALILETTTRAQETMSEIPLAYK